MIPFRKIKHTPQYKTQKALADMYSDLYHAGAKELRFYRIAGDSLVSALEEITTMTNDPLTKRVATLAHERHELDKLIHARMLFGNK